MAAFYVQVQNALIRAKRGLAVRQGFEPWVQV
jgi:hypothetical protein